MQNKELLVYQAFFFKRWVTKAILERHLSYLNNKYLCFACSEKESLALFSTSFASFEFTNCWSTNFSSNKLLASVPPPEHVSPVQGKCIAFLSSWCTWFSFAVSAHLTLYPLTFFYFLLSFHKTYLCICLEVLYTLCIFFSWQAHLDIHN